MEQVSSLLPPSTTAILKVSSGDAAASESSSVSTASIPLASFRVGTTTSTELIRSAECWASLELPTSGAVLDDTRSPWVRNTAVGVGRSARKRVRARTGERAERDRLAREQECGRAREQDQGR